MGLRYLGNIIRPGYNPLASNVTTGVNTAQYQGVFTLQQQAQAQNTQAWTADPLFRNSTLLLQADNAANGAQNNTFLDSSSNAFAITRNGNTTQGTFTPFSLQPGAWSNYFNGSTDYIGNTTNSVSGFDLSTGDWTVEAWVYPTALNSINVILNLPNASGNNSGLNFYIDSTGKLFQDNGSVATTGAGAVSLNTWTHVAAVRVSGSTQLYVNGIAVGSAITQAPNTAQYFLIGRLAAIAANYFTGYISNLRVVKGRGVYTANFTPPTSALGATSGGTNPPTGTQTSLLTCQSNRFVDNGGLATPNTINIGGGSPSVQAFSPFAPQYQWTSSVIGGSGYFDGTGDSLAFPTSQASLLPGSGAFTYEVWFYQTVATTNSPLASYGTGTGNLRFFVATPTAVTLWNGATNLVNQAVTNNLNSWNHFVIQRDGSNVVSIYYNGTRIYTGTVSSNFNAGTLSLGVDGAVYWSGYLSGFKATIGSAVYSGTSITVPTAPPSPTGSTACLNFTNAGIVDATMKNNLETVGNAQISTAVVKYGSGSMYFDGTGDWLLLPHSANQFLSTGQFTIEMWVYRNASAAYGLVAKGTGTTGWLVSLNASNQVVFTFTTSTITSSGAVAASTWTHIAVVREGIGTNQTKIYINGVNDGQGTVATDFNQTNSMYVGADRTGGSAFNGYIDDLRITRGIARYTQNFIPPSVALPRQ